MSAEAKPSSAHLTELRLHAEMVTASGLLGWWEADAFAEGFPVPPGVDSLLAACDPPTVLALVRAVEATLRWRAAGQACAAAWRSVSGTSPTDPARKVAYAADDEHRAARHAYETALEPFTRADGSSSALNVAADSGGGGGLGDA